MGLEVQIRGNYPVPIGNPQLLEIMEFTRLADPEAVRPKASLDAGRRYLWVLLSRVWQSWRAALAIVRPETVIAWHRQVSLANYKTGGDSAV